jgi:hypothetical protein
MLDREGNNLSGCKGNLLSSIMFQPTDDSFSDLFDIEKDEQVQPTYKKSA